MVIDAKKNLLKYNLKQIKIEDKEKRILLFLSDNNSHKIKDIRKYIRDLTELQTRLRIKKLNRKTKQELNVQVISKRTNKHGFTGWDLYKASRLVAITY